MESILRGLNVAQKAAVTSTASVLQVLAPPGSGKTKTLTSRVAYLLAHHGYAPRDVICCTFTIKASREMRERLRGMVGNELESKLILGTFHSICRRYLVTYGHLIDIPTNFGIADSDDSLGIIKRAIKRLNFSIDARTARSRISHRKARGKRLEELSKPVKTVEAQEFATIFQEYEAALRTSNLLDYDDLLLRCVDLLRQHPGCVSNVEALLIDEFQDTNIVQFELMKLLASAKRRITIVGDPDQSIYGFRSAEIENLQRMRAFYPEAVVINLEENYRSCSSILNIAQEVIEQDADRPNKKLKSTKRYGTLPVLRRLPNPFEEARWIAAEIKRVVTVTANMLQYGDISILLRSAFLSLHIEKALTALGMPYRMVGGKRFFDRVEVRLLVDYLKTISHPDNNSALLAVINTPKRKVGNTTVKELMKVANTRNESLWNVLQNSLTGNLSLEKRLSKPAEQGLQELVSLIKTARQKMLSMEPLETPGKLIEHIVSSLKYRDFLQKEYAEDHEERWENVQELLTQAADATSAFNIGDEDLPDVNGIAQQRGTGAEEVLARFLANVSLSTEVGSEDGQEKQRITISTIHSAKGLEWPVCFIPAVYEGSIPHSRAEDTDEERRLLYVAMTRAKALLYMTFPVMQQRDESESVMSQFLPAKVIAMTSQTGCAINGEIVKQIAEILGRNAPTSQELANSLRSINENESSEDDIWPADGTHLQKHFAAEAAYPGIILQKGQSLSDALKSSGPRVQYRQHSTISYTTNINGNASQTPPADLTSGFTTAHHHFKTQPQLPEKPQPNIKLSRPNTGEASGSEIRKKPKFGKTASDQGNIHSFFTQGSLKPAEYNSRTSTAALLQPIRTNYTLPRSPSISATTQRAEAYIPPELSGHRPVSGNIGFRHAHSTLQPLPPNDLNQKRDHYSAFVSSPTRDQPDPKKRHDSSQTNPTSGYNGEYGPKMEHFHAQCHYQSNAPSSLTLATRDASEESIASLHNTTLGQLNTKARNPYRTNPHTRLVGTNTLQGQHVSLSVKTTMNKLQDADTDGYRNRTLGVRRTMSGWADRKHK